MKAYVEKLISKYPKMLEQREFVRQQLKTLRQRAVSLDDVIEMMVFSHPDGERVQSSGYSDKTAKIAMNYQRVQKKMNEETMHYWMDRYQELNTEIIFFENAVDHLEKPLREVLDALVIKGMTWDEAESSLYLNRRTISNRRHEAINALARIYQVRASEMECYLLS